MSKFRPVDIRNFVLDEAAAVPPSTPEPSSPTSLPVTPSPQTPHTHREHTIQAPMFEPLMQALDTTMTNGCTRKRYVNATWTQHGRWLQTRASPSFITFATPFPLTPSPFTSSLSLLAPSSSFFSPFWT